MLKLDPEADRLWSSEPEISFADRPYVYSITGQVGGDPIRTAVLSKRRVETTGTDAVVTGVFEALGLVLRQRFHTTEAGIEETISFKNAGAQPVNLLDIGLGFSADLGSRPAWRLCAIPFRTQLDGSRHDYAVADLMAGRFGNAIYSDSSRPEPPLVEQGRVRSEAWAWWDGQRGLLIAKYNPLDIELSVAAPILDSGEARLRFGGVGTCLYGEPTRGHFLAPGQEFAFGTTHYVPFEGPIQNAFYAYRAMLEAREHTFPPDYDPPVNWNELYDVGWYHSDPAALNQHYTRAAVLDEAAKARDCGCDLLYLDPGWEVAEGTTLWDENRLGSAAELATVLKRDYGLKLGFRTILRCYVDHWPREFWVDHGEPAAIIDGSVGNEPAVEETSGERNRTRGPIPWGDQSIWELCLCDDTFWEEKLQRIEAIVGQGVRFLMVDEMDWRGPCFDPGHGHPVPSSPRDHVEAVYSLCRELRLRYPDLTIECHDPVWPWFGSIYVPTYFQQGIGLAGAYDENWGFEYMWNCIEDLKTGKALALYDYNLACSIPLYLHITMAADNDNCLFFWWAASTIRHLGIGGKVGAPSVELAGKLAPHDPDRRFSAYREQMRIYRSLKPYFVRGVFHGLSETAHLHTLPGRAGGVLVLFNLTDEHQTLEALMERAVLQADRELPVSGAIAEWDDTNLRVYAPAEPMSAFVVTIGDAANSLPVVV